MTQFIPIIHGFKALIFEHGTVPTERMLLEMIKPCADYEVTKLAPANIKDWDCIPNLGSQFLLQAYSNKLVDNSLTPSGLKEMLESQCIDFDEFCYHYCIIGYIHTFFGQQQNLAVDKEAIRKLRGIYSKLIRSHEALSDPSKSDHQIERENREFNDKALSDVKGSKKITELKKRENHVLEIAENLKRKFPDYQKASDFIAPIYDNQKIGIAFLAGIQETIDFKFNERQSRYRPTNEMKAQKVNRIQQCEYCSLWYETAISGNGKLRAHCRQKSCKQAWDRLRRRTANL
jgi:hypothetical protein